MKFDGILLCTDLDETLLKNDKSVSRENIEAIEYFKSNGGKFTFITGRIPRAVTETIARVKPNAPIGCLNGASIYDFENDKNLYEMVIDKSVSGLLEYIDKEFPSVGIEIVTHGFCYFCKENYRTEEHKRIEKAPDLKSDFYNAPGKWAKVLLIDEKEPIDKMIAPLLAHKDAKNFDFVRSTDFYYEILPPGASKGNVLLKIADILNIDKCKTIAVGDNENDVSMLKAAGAGFAVSNAVDAAKEAADYITVSNEENAIAKIIGQLDSDDLILEQSSGRR